MNCADCSHWKRQPRHPELPQQHHWGDCERLAWTDADEFFLAYAEEPNEGGDIIAVKFETHESFGCTLWRMK